ncbi:glycosyltransferase [Mammaliicoccus sp. Dog046]|uniref:glycosyltransferase n=1 Tax=Mammaliicoccus sp. Dog046 TaxID=3034233 RepID=UPI002B258674|nr:glycosyltransferase [Mammaliicoccus sp. Dog046]WQK85182.1 glycosyltransferase [Mammaliicoccus sp. Dog046]
MNYFVISNLGNKITGIEKAVMNRLKLFKTHQMKAKVLTLSWNPRLHANAEIFGVQKSIFSIYDYFQEAINVQSHTVKDWIEYWEYEHQYEIKYIPNTNDIRVFSNGKRIIYASFYDNTYKHIDYINYFDTKDNKVKREIYDSRGFLSRVIYLTTDQKMLHESFLSPKGEVKIEIFYDPESKNDQLTRILLHNHKNRVYMFESKNEWFAFFYESLYQDGDIYFSDKTAITSPPFLLVDSKIPVISCLHSTHVKDNDNIAFSDTKNIYQSVFSHLHRFSGIIVSTHQQKHDVEQRIQSSIPVFNIPVGYTDDVTTIEEQPLPNGPIKLASIARYSPEKQLDHQIRLLSKLKEDFKNIELHFFGYGSEITKMKALVKTLQLEDHVKFRGFIPDLTTEMRTSHLSLITSNMEGFSLALLESLSNGLPTISYDIAYGPSELIINGTNGFLVPKNNEQELYKQVKYFLEHPELQQTMRLNSVKEAQRYAQSAVIKQWQQLLNTIHSNHK